MTALLDPSDPLVRDLEPSVRLALAAELRIRNFYVEVDGIVDYYEHWNWFQGREEWGGHSSPDWIRDERQQAWFKMARIGKAREATVRQTESLRGHAVVTEAAF